MSPAWRGPLSWSRMRFHTTQPSVQLLRSVMTLLARRRAACQVPPMPPSVYSRCLSGKASWTTRTLSKWSPVYQWKARAPDVFRGFRVVVGRLDALVHQAAVVVPDHEFHVGEAGFVERGPEEVFHEVALFVGGEDAGFPDLRGQGLVLDGEAPDGDALGLVGLDVFHDSSRPRSGRIRA